MVPHSSVDPASDGRAFLRGQAVGVERALDDYLAGCPLVTASPEQARTDGSADQTLLVNTMAQC
jgi:hypothetical protein